jgi:hypothetical protein
MDQNAFRNLLNSATSTRPTPRSTIESSNGGGDGANGSGGGGGKNKTWKPRPKTGKDGMIVNSSGRNSNESNTKIQFRDRAEERRKGLHAEEDEAEEALYKSLGVEESKFLGGDLAHTHLVKGLDFALLAKMRREGGGGGGEGGESSMNSTKTMSSSGPQITATSSAPPPSSFSGIATNVQVESKTSSSSSHFGKSIQASSHFGKSILDAVASSLQVQNQRQHLSSSSSSSSISQYNHSRFLPGRTTFSYSCAANGAADCALLFANAEEADSLPTISMRETVFLETRTLVIDHPNADIEDRVLDVLLKHKVILSGKRRRRVKQESAAPVVVVNDNLARQSEKSTTFKGTIDKKLSKVEAKIKADKEEDEEEDIFSGVGTYSAVVASASKTAEVPQTLSDVPSVKPAQTTLPITKASPPPLSSSLSLQSSTTAIAKISESSSKQSRFSATAAASTITASTSHASATELVKNTAVAQKAVLTTASSSSSSSREVFSPLVTAQTPKWDYDPLLRATLDHGLGGLEGFDEWDAIELNGKATESLVDQRRKADEKKRHELIHGEGGQGTDGSIKKTANGSKSRTSHATAAHLSKVENRNISSNRNKQEDEDDSLLYGKPLHKRQYEYSNEVVDEDEEEDKEERNIISGVGKHQSKDHTISSRTEDDLLDEEFEKHTKSQITNSSSSIQTGLSTISSSSLSMRTNQVVDADIVALRSGSFTMLGGAREASIAATIAAKNAARNAKHAAGTLNGRKQFVSASASATTKPTMTTSSTWRPGSWNDDEGNEDDDDGDGSDGGGGGGGGSNKRAKLDTELIQINRILEERKGGGGGGKMPNQPSLKHKKGKGNNHAYDED